MAIAFAAYVASFAALVILGRETRLGDWDGDWVFTYGGFDDTWSYRLGKGELALYHFYRPLEVSCRWAGIPLGHLNPPCRL